MKVFFMPHIGTQECDKSQLKILCDECAKSFIDPVSDFSNMSMKKIFGLLPAGKSAFAQYYIPSRSSKSESGSEEKKEATLLPDLRNLGHTDFRRLANRLGSRYENGMKNAQSHSDLHISTDCMPLDSFSNDVLIQILSYLSFKRVCYMGYVSSRFLNASKEEVLWELLYKRKFPNLAFANEFPYKEKLDKIPDCDECFYYMLYRTNGKVRKRKPCTYRRRKHSWFVLFQV
jgi:hypothetical protein